MPTLLIAPPLRYYVDKQSEVVVDAQTVGGAIQALVQIYPALKGHLYKDENILRAHVLLFLNGENVKDFQGLDTPLNVDDKLRVFMAVVGG
jgi:molybdopterin converting factor small subunit